MAFFHRNEEPAEDKKLSGFSKPSRTAATGEQAASEGRRKTGVEGKIPRDQRNKRFWMALLVDLILLAVLFGAVAGCIFGYRALREWYAPEWETRDVIFRVEMTEIDPDLVKYGQDGRPTMVGNGIWSSDRTDAALLGTVTDVQTVLVVQEDGTNTLTLYLTVEATAYYREGKGYRMGETMLLAGAEGVFRVKGLTGEGRILSMHEMQDETTALPEDDTAPADPSAGTQG